MTDGPPATARAKKGIVFYGTGSLALVLHDLLEANGYRLVAIFSDFPIAHATNLAEPIVGEREIERWLEDKRDAKLSFAIAIGNRHRARLERFKFLFDKGLKPATLTHPTSFISPTATVGLACQVLAFALVGTHARIGNAVIINSHASVDHECVLGDGVYVGPGAVLAGEVEIGACTFIGAGAVVLPNIKIAADVIVGAGAVVAENILEAGTYAGVPARRLT